MDTPFGDSPQDLNGLTVIDGEGHKVGSVQRVYKDDASGAPEWVTVRTGLFGTKETFVPLADAHREEDKLRIPYSKERIKDAPRVDAESHLDAAEEQDLYRYYGRSRPEPGETGGGRETGAQGGAPSGERSGQSGAPLAGAGAGAGMGAGGMAMSGRSREGGTGMGDKEMNEEARSSGEGEGSMPGTHGNTASSRESGTRSAWNARTGESGKEGTSRSAAGRPGMADREVTLHEERMDIGTEEHETGRARLNKRVVTEETSHTVPVSHEEVRMTREKISDEDRRSRAGTETPEMEDGEVEITLHEERPVVRKESVPVERVRLETERVTEQQEVSTELRKEEADFDDGTSGQSGATRSSGTSSRGKETGPGKLGKETGTTKGTDAERPESHGKRPL